MLITMKEELLIRLIQTYEFLYNQNCKHYRNQQKRQEAWEEIAEELNMSWQDCRDSWMRLRNSYTNALKRRKPSSGERESVKKFAKWKFEDEMAFVLPYMEPKQSQNNIKLEMFVNDNDDLDNNFIMLDNKQSDPLTLDSQQQSNDYSQSLPISNSTPSFKKRQLEKSSMDEVVTLIKRMKSQITDISQQTTCSSDETDLFFLSLAKSVKKLPQVEQIKLKMSISNLVFQAELENVTTVDSSEHLS